MYEFSPRMKFFLRGKVSEIREKIIKGKPTKNVKY